MHDLIKQLQDLNVSWWKLSNLMKDKVSESTCYRWYTKGTQPTFKNQKIIQKIIDNLSKGK